MRKNPKAYSPKDKCSQVKLPMEPLRHNVQGTNII